MPRKLHMERGHGPPVMSGSGAPVRAVALALALAAPASQAVLPTQPVTWYREGEVLVRYHGTADDRPATELRSRHGLVPRRRLSRGRLELLELPRFTTTAAALEVLRRDPAVAHAEPNYLSRPRIACPDDPAFFCPDDPEFDELWGLRSIGQRNYADPDPDLASIPGADMDMLLAWDPGADGTFERIGDPSVVIAILDDGFNLGHPDLAGNFVAGFNFTNNTTDAGATATEFHGTLVAGAAGAIGNNGIGVAGTAWNARIMPLKFGYDTASHIAALAFARDHGASIVNASFGGPKFSQEVENAINDLAAHDILYVTAAGNDNSNTDLARLSYPANFDAPNIVSVAASNRQDAVASFSQYGSLTTDVAAPGLQIVTTTRDGGYSLPLNCGFVLGTCGVSGTSFSSPYTAGVAALIRSAHPGATALEVRARLIEGAEAGDGARLRTAGGRVNAANALDLAPRPALIIRAVDWIDPNRRLDPGESLSVDVTVENLWQGATGVTGTLSADNGVTVVSGATDFGDVGNGASATARFDLTVEGGITGHRYVHFTLALGADGGAYAASRSFIAEIGRLETGTTVMADFAPRRTDIYDDFHAWHYDFDGTLPPGHAELVFETTSSALDLNSPDIDVLVKRGEPPHYAISLGAPPGAGYLCTSGTAANCQDSQVYLGAEGGGDEAVVYRFPEAGTYHVVIANYAQLSGGLSYTLRAYTRPLSGPARIGSGGRLPPSVLAVLALAALARRRPAA